jgi:oxygen-independent coproporphyrinogen-3 oxidase
VSSPAPNPSLLARYGGPAPRYTSYPTALRFEPFTPEDFQHELLDHPPRPLSLYVHLPFCRSVCLFCGCHAVHTRDPRRGPAYIDALITEADAVSHWLPGRRPVVQMHWGGGTPTFHSAPELARLAEALWQRFYFLPGAERSVEVDPRVTTPDHFRVLRQAGFNRISLGVQDFDPSVQRAIHRIQPEAQTRAVLDQARALGFHGISVDLICGLPLQTPASFAQTVDRVIAAAPDRISLFSFAHLPSRIPHQRGIRSADLPSPETRLAMAVRASAALQEAGWRAIGMDHFARPGDPLCRALDEGSLHRNFQGYTTHAGTDLIGLGASAISAVGRIYAQNEKDLTSYSRLVQARHWATVRGIRLNDEDLLRRRLIMALMCRFEIDWTREGYSPSPSEWRRLKEMAGDGLVELDAIGVRATGTGRWFIRAIAQVFDPHSTEATAACSRIV